MLAFVTLSETKVTLHYWGDAVNTEWDDEFSLVGSGWGHTHSGLGPGTGSTVFV